MHDFCLKLLRWKVNLFGLRIDLVMSIDGHNFERYIRTHKALSSYVWQKWSPQDAFCDAVHFFLVFKCVFLWRSLYLGYIWSCFNFFLLFNVFFIFQIVTLWLFFVTFALECLLLVFLSSFVEICEVFWLFFVRWKGFKLAIWRQIS